MRITVLVPSRDRPQKLQESVTRLCLLAARLDDIRIVVGCDADDPATITMAHMLALRGWPVQPHVAVRGPSLATLLNRMAELYRADAYVCVADDTMCITRGWDLEVAASWAVRPDGVWWWQARSTYAIVSEKWRQAAGHIFVDYFPYWWADVWLGQVWRYASGGPMLQIRASLADQSEVTQQMRDLEEWTAFFWSRDGERIHQAREIARKLGWPAVEDMRPLAMAPNPAFMSKISAIEANQGEKAPPTPGYRKALARMRAMAA